jgi:hypothetical protein
MAAAIMLVGCTGPGVPATTTPKPLIGQLQVPAEPGFKTAMAAADLMSNATVSLVGFTGSTTLASVTTDAQGHFTIPAPAVAPNTAFYAVASKRPSPLAQRLNLRTLVLWDGADWQSVSRLNTANVHVINPTTTAVTLMHAATPAKAVLPAEILGVVGANGGLYDQVALWAGGADAPASATTTQFASHMVASLLPNDRDPLSALSMITSVTALGRATTEAATVGETDVAIDGYGFDPQPDQNVVTFSAGGRTVLATPLGTSTATQLRVRVPDYLPPATTGSPATTTILVYNRAGAKSFPVAGWTGLVVHGPQVVTDTAAVIPDVLTAPTLTNGLATGTYDATTKRTYAAWVDQRYFGSNTGRDTVMIRSWTDAAGFDTAQRVSTDVGDAAPGHLEEENARKPVVVADEVNGRAHVLWEGHPWMVAGRSLGIFHRIYMPGATPPWSTGTSNVAGDSRNVAEASPGAAATNYRHPAAAMDGAKVLVAYKQDGAPDGEIMLRQWNGTSMAAGNLGRADWGNGTAQTPTNLSSSLFDSGFPNVAVGGPGGGWPYHIIWFDKTSTGNTAVNNGLIRYARAQDAAGTLTIQPAPVATTGAPSSLVLSDGSRPVDNSRPAIAADAAGNVLAVWRESDGLYWRHLTYNGAAPAADGTVAQVPGSAATASHGVEGNPTLVQGANADEFYLVSATIGTLPVGDGMELWVRRYAAGTWTTSRSLRPSAAISSELPWLIPRSGDLSLLWFEGRKLLHLPLIWPLDGV